MICNC